MRSSSLLQTEQIELLSSIPTPTHKVERGTFWQQKQGEESPCGQKMHGKFEETKENLCDCTPHDDCEHPRKFSCSA